MKTRLITILPTLFFLCFFSAAQSGAENHGHEGHSAMQHDTGHGVAADHADMKSTDHSGMQMEGDMIMLENDMVDGVKAMAHLRDISKTMADMGMDKTHHFMVMFTDTETGKTLEDGLVAVKVIAPGGQKLKAVKLMGMEGSFGADVSLAQKGDYIFEVGTKLDDGQKRQFQFHYTVN